ncbi:NAD(P)-binding protein [Hypoxylon cercidicola]|nr:NAD(P)-binding protein [Hypoxylon cercidicola]
MSQLLESRAAFESSFVGFLYRQWLMHRKPYPAGTTLSGQTAIVTGSNSGLGFESARQLLELGLSHLIVSVRSQARGDAAADKLRNEFPNSTISVWLLDMESYDSVTAFAKKCETLARIDLVILNAGLRSDQFQILKTTQHEQSFQVNYLSTSLLAILLLPILKSKKVPSGLPPRLSIVSSDTAYWASLKTTGPILAQFDQPDLFEPFHAYQCSKLVQQFFITRLAEQVSADDVIINASNPGLCKGTGFAKDSTVPLLGRISFWCFQNLNGRTAQNGANAMVDAVVVKGKESHGSYVSDWTIQPFPTILYTKQGQDVGDRIWEETMEELNFAGASKVVQGMKH